MGIPDRETEGIFDALLVHCWEKPLEKERTPKRSVAWKLGNRGEALRRKVGSTPKTMVYWGHPWAVSEFGEKKEIPFRA